MSVLLVIANGKKGKVMSFTKIRTIKVSERVFDLVCEELDLLASDYGAKISGYLQTFNNCREQGFYLTISSNTFDSKDMYVWVFENRTSDEIVVVISHTYPSNNGLFDDEAYEERQYFKFNELQESADYILKAIKEHFRHEIKGK